MRRLVILALILVAALVGAPLVFADEAGQNKADPRQQTAVTLAKETTRITEPLRKDGYPDYVAALDRQAKQGVTPQNNVAVVLFQELGPGEVSEEMSAAFFRGLGIDPVPADGEYLVSFSEFLEQKGIEAQRRAEIEDNFYDSLDSQAPWSQEDFPLVAEWLATYEQHLDRIVRGSKRSRYYSPMMLDEETPHLLIAVLLPSLSHFRTASRPLHARAMLRLGEGNIDDAWSDLLACHRLARLVGQGPFLIDVLVSSAIERPAIRGIAGLAHHGKLTAEQVKKFRAQLDALPKAPRVADVMDQGERYMFLDCGCAMARDGLYHLTSTLASGDVDVQQTAWGDILKTLSRQAIDWDVVLRTGNAGYDRLVGVARAKDHSERAKRMQKLEDDIVAMGDRSKRGLLGSPLLLLAGEKGKHKLSRMVGEMLLTLLMPGLTSVMQSEHQTLTLAHMENMSLDLAAYRAQRGNYPERLEDLIPDVRAALPVDEFTGAHFRYRRDETDYVLYSVGSNGKDDEGREHGEDDDHPGADDIVLETTRIVK
ncbi:MAG TPA: hypothetical protein VMX74_05880 [Pirellulales bacterium]|nr:hypothetical protein [Pirellulales bacterium]